MSLLKMPLNPAGIVLLLVISLSLAFCATAQSKKARDREKDPQYQYEKAVVALKYELTEAAIEYLKQAVALDPGHYRSWNLLGFAQANKKDFSEAASAYQKCIELRPDLSEAHNNLGFVYKELGLTDKAEEEYKKALAIDGNAEAGFNLARLYFEQNKLEQALDSIQKSIRKNNSSAAFHNLHGVILNQMRRYAEAITSFQNALLYSPDDIYMNINLGIAYFNYGDYDKARKVFEKVLPRIQDPTLRDRIGEYLKMIKESPKPIEPIDGSCRGSPPPDRAHKSDHHITA